MTKEPIYETLDKLSELAQNQDRALKLSKEIILLKNRINEICEEEITIYKKENRVLKICFFGIIVCNVLQLILSYANKG